MKRLLPLFLILLSFAAFSSVYRLTWEKVGKPFPGYLVFKNGVVGAYYVPGWSGPVHGISYHDLAPAGSPAAQDVFNIRDYIAVVLIPAVSGLLFFLLGVAVCAYLPNEPGRLPLLIFHFLVGLYLILSPDFHLTHRFVYLHLAAFAFIPAVLLHFSLLFPEEARGLRRFLLLPYLASAVLLVPYVALFFSNPHIWIKVEYAVVFYVLLAYVFWVVRLVRTLRRPQFETNRIIARHLLIGQLVAFTLPFAAAIAVFVGRVSFPLNLAAPVTLLFPAALFIGIVLARLRQSQMQLIQTEKMATLGNLMAGLAHELKNPLNFVVANLDALKEKAVTPDLKDIADDIEEGAGRMRAILDNFRYFLSPQRAEESVDVLDIRDIVEHAVRLLAPKWKDRIEIRQQWSALPKISGSVTELGQVFVNLIANACEAIAGKGTIEIIGRAGEGIEITVRDTGIGIPRDQLPRIFDPFFTTKPQGEGTGLGLSIVQRIVKNYGGTIEIKSMASQGTEVMLRLPYG